MLIFGIKKKKIYINLQILVVEFYMKEGLHTIEKETPKIKYNYLKFAKVV